MKKIKKIIAISCSMLLLCVSTLPVFATEKQQSPYECLLNYGYSEDFLLSLSNEMVLQMYEAIGNNDIINVEETTFQIDEFGNLRPIDLMGTISESSLTITIATAAVNRQGTREIGLCMYTAVWEWSANKPLIKYKDPISINWISDVFTMSSFYSQDTGRNSLNVDYTVVHEYNYPSESAQGGVGFYNNLPLNYTYIGGALILLLQPTSTMYNGNSLHTQINFNYYHNRNPLGLGVSIGYEGNGITINPGPLYDSTSRYTTFNFSRI